MNDISTGAVSQILGGIPQTIWLITSTDGTRNGGLTATWVMQASLDYGEPVMVISIASNHATRELIDRGQRFALHTVTAEHADWIWQLATTSGHTADKLKGLPTAAGRTGVPVFPDAASCLECQVIARVDTGDRVYFWGRVEHAAVHPDVHSTSERRTPITDLEWFAMLNDQQRRLLRQQREQDCAIQEPQWQLWLAHLPPSCQPRPLEVKE